MITRRDQKPEPPTRTWPLPLLIAVGAAILVMAQVDPAGDYPGAPQGPGETVDEVFNVQEGVRLAVAGKAWLLGAPRLETDPSPLTLRDLFGEAADIPGPPPVGYHLPDHPPLGRWWLGFVHQMVLTVAPPHDHPTPFVTAAARCGSTLAFAATVFLVGWLAGRWYGPVGGAAASLGLVLMPRVLGHAHLASLETCIGLAWTAAVVVLAVRWSSAEPPGWKTALWTGMVFGLALLTKIQGVLLPAPVAVWALWRWRARAIVPLAVWGLAGLATFFALWPWLWLDPVAHFKQYLGSTTERISLGVWYLGERFADRDVPWHYPWVMFLVTVPVGLQALGFWGVVRSLRLPSPAPGTAEAATAAGERLVLGSLLTPLVLFSIPRIAVYDGERLFLVVFPLWALFVGKGAAALWERWCVGENKSSQDVADAASVGATVSPSTGCMVRRAAFALFFVAQGTGLVLAAPCWLTYYNGLTGGVAGAARLGFERSYWADAVTRDLLEQLVAATPDGATVAVAPVLHQLQLDDLVRQSPILRSKQLRLIPWSAEKPAEFLLVFDRLADLPAVLRDPPAAFTPIAEVRRSGVRLAGAYRRESP